MEQGDKYRRTATVDSDVSGYGYAANNPTFKHIATSTPSPETPRKNLLLSDDDSCLLSRHQGRGLRDGNVCAGIYSDCVHGYCCGEGLRGTDSCIVVGPGWAQVLLG